MSPRLLMFLLLFAPLACVAAPKATGGKSPAPTTAATPAGLDATVIALLGAARGGQLHRFDALVAQGVDINATNAGGRSALMLAAFYGNDGVLRALLAEGADVNARDKAGRTALMEAAANGHTEAVRMLMLRGADVNITSQGKQNALSLAKAGGHEEIAKLLADAGAKEPAKK